MTNWQPIGDTYVLEGPSSGLTNTPTFETTWNIEVLALLRRIVGGVGGLATHVLIDDSATPGVSLPTVTREDGTRAIPVDTEISIDNATLKINNLFVASTTGLVAGAKYMVLQDITAAQQTIAGGTFHSGLETDSLMMGWDGATHREVLVDVSGNLKTNSSSTTRTPGYAVYSANHTFAAGFQSISIMTDNTFTGDIGGQALGPNTYLTFAVNGNDTLGALTVNRTTGSFTAVTIV